MTATQTRTQHSQRTLSGVAEATSVLGGYGGFELMPVLMEVPAKARLSPIVREVGAAFDISGFTRACTSGGRRRRSEWDPEKHAYQ